VHPDIEAGAAAVGTIAALTDTAEGQSGDVQGGVVARDTTRAGGVNDLEIVSMKIVEFGKAFLLLATSALVPKGYKPKGVL
jgi:hypothetical protein